nr:hypothetical protein [Streptomyces chartreusis]
MPHRRHGPGPGAADLLADVETYRLDARLLLERLGSTDPDGDPGPARRRPVARPGGSLGERHGHVTPSRRPAMLRR